MDASIDKKKVRYGFMFKLNGQNHVTMYDQNVSDEIAELSQKSATAITVNHTIRRGPRAGQVDSHVIDCMNDIVGKKGTYITHTLVRINMDDDAPPAEPQEPVAPPPNPMKEFLERAKERKEEALKRVREETIADLLRLLEL